MPWNRSKTEKTQEKKARRKGKELPQDVTTTGKPRQQQINTGYRCAVRLCKHEAYTLGICRKHYDRARWENGKTSVGLKENLHKYLTLRAKRVTFKDDSKPPAPAQNKSSAA